MANILPENETTTFEEQTYVNPETSLNEQNTFIENLRANQQQNNAQIQQDTHNLGTDVPSNLGGLVGGEGYFTSRYQTPQTNSLTTDLRATAQAQALGEVLQNQQAMWKNRYNEAYRAAQKRARRSGSGGGGDTTGGNDETLQGGVDEKRNDENAHTLSPPANMPDASEGKPGDTITRTVPGGSEGYFYDTDQNHNIVLTDDPSYHVWDDGFYHQGKQPLETREWWKKTESYRQNIPFVGM